MSVDNSLLIGNVKHQLLEEGYAVVQPLDDFHIAVKTFDEIRYSLGIPRVFPWLKTSDDPTCNVVVSNRVTTRKFGDEWHQDHAYESKPPRFTILLGESVPDVGGETELVCRRRLADLLDDNLKSFLLDRDVIIEPPKEAIEQATNRGVVLERRLCKGLAQVDGHLQLEVSPYHSSYDKLAEEVEAISCLEQLFENNKLIVKIQKNSILIWDNYRMFHRAVNNYGSAYRRLYRSIIDEE